jgi:hypothetical protein
MCDLVKINVGGTIFSTRIQTLKLSNYFKEWDHNIERDIFVDRNPKAFVHILEYLRDINYPYPQKYEYELDFYEIDKTKVHIIPEINKLIISSLDKICDKMNNIKGPMGRTGPIGPIGPIGPMGRTGPIGPMGNII